MMSDRIAVTVKPERLQLPPGGRAEVTLTVTNQGGVVDQFGLLVEGLDPSWFSLRAGVVSLFPGAQGQLALEVHVPEGPAAQAGVQRILLKVVSRDDPTATAVVELPLDVLPVGTLEFALVPQRVTSRGIGRYRLQMTNRGNAEQVVDLAVSDPAQALESHLSADRMAVLPGASQEVPFTLRPQRRPLIAPPQQYPFAVTATPAGVEAAEPLATLEGELVYRSPLAFLAGLSPRARALLLGLAGLLIAALAAVWFIAAPGRQTPFIPTPTAAPGQTPGAGQPTASPSAQPTTPTSAGAAAERPKIVMFELGVPPNGRRGQFELRWEVLGAKEVLVDGQKKQPTGSMIVETLDDREYELAATSEAGLSEKKSIGVVILKPPEIRDFRASAETVMRGQPATLSWDARRADRAGVNGQAVDPSKGTLEVRPDGDTTYTLLVENELGRVQRQVLVRVVEPTPTP